MAKGCSSAPAVDGGAWALARRRGRQVTDSFGGGAAERVGIATSGLALVLFLVLHLAGVSLAVLDPPLFERFATWLHGQLWLPVTEVAMAVALLAHPLLSLARTLAHRRLRGPEPSLRRSRRGGVERMVGNAAAWLPWSGGLLLLFLTVHLNQLRWPRPAPGAEREVLLIALHSPFSLLLYGLAGGAVALHLLHGNESAHRSLGLLDSANGGRIRATGRWLALALGGGFTLVPLALVLIGADGGATGAP